jgi:hypothetical protein
MKSLILQKLLLLINGNAIIERYFDLEQAMRYIEVLQLLKPSLLFFRPLHHLPVNEHTFLCKAFNLPDEVGKHAWDAFCSIAWDMEDLDSRTEKALRYKHAILFVKYGLPHNVGT